MTARGSPFLLSTYVDFRGDVERGVYTHRVLDEMMGLLSDMGIRRLYWWYDGHVDPESYWFNGLIDLAAYGPETLREIGQPVAAAGIGTSAPYEYGFNEILVGEYRDRFGRDLLEPDVVDAIRTTATRLGLR